MPHPIHVRYSVIFGLLGLAQLYLALLHGGAAWLLVWPAVSFLIASAAYAKLGPGVFGKRRDGTFSIPNRLLMLPYVMFAGAVWRLQRCLTNEPAYHQVAPGLWLGRRPYVDELPEGVSLVVDLTAEFPPARGMKTGREYRCLPTLDYTAPDPPQFAELVREVAAWKGGVFLHCAVGHGRSATVAAAVLIARGLAPDFEHAVRLLTGARPRVKLNAVQRRLLENFHHIVEDEHRDEIAEDNKEAVES